MAKLASRRRVAPPKLASRKKAVERPQLASQPKAVAPPKLKQKSRLPAPPSLLDGLAMPVHEPTLKQESPLPISLPVSLPADVPTELKPPAADATLRQQLDDFAQVLGYKPGDRLYVRALLPKNLSDQLALKHNLRFEIEENGKQRLIPNTRRGYLTVGSWELTHLRKNKEPAVYEDGLAKLSELNKEGRGVADARNARSANQNNRPGSMHSSIDLLRSRRRDRPWRSAEVD